MAPHYVRTAKALTAVSAGTPIAEHLQLERHGIADSMATEDLRRGVSAFLAGEKPEFTAGEPDTPVARIASTVTRAAEPRGKEGYEEGPSRIVLLLLASLVLVACGGSSSGSSESTAAAKQRRAAAGGSGGEESEGGGGRRRGRSNRPRAASRSPADRASAEAGAVTVEFTNPQGVPHDVAIEDSGGEVVGQTEIVAEGESSTTVELEPGTYKFFCTIPGHREAGMEGTLTVK